MRLGTSGSSSTFCLLWILSQHIFQLSWHEGTVCPLEFYLSFCNFPTMIFWCRTFLVCCGCLALDKRLMISSFDVRSRGIPARWQEAHIHSMSCQECCVYSTKSLQEFLISHFFMSFAEDPL